MDERIEIWNDLHDGGITGMSWDGHEELTLFVSIPYLRRRLQPLGDSFVLTLSGVHRVEFCGFDGESRSLSEELETGSPEILSTDSESMPVTIATTTGQLTLDFEVLAISLDTGGPIEFEAVEKVAREYWTEWQARADRAQKPVP